MSKTLLSKANQHFREKQYALALKLYTQAVHDVPTIASIIQFNIQLVHRRLAHQTEQVSEQSLLENKANAEIHAPLEKPEILDQYAFEQIKSTRLFNADWYLSQYKASHSIEGNPLAHYLIYGVHEKLNPSVGFDTDHYLKSYPDVAMAGINPLVHYVCQGIKEGRVPTPHTSHLDFDEVIAEPAYISRLPHEVKAVNKVVRAIAFYLPQFHAIPENNQWWGSGFTEWTNVAPATPQFNGHYQPHVPDSHLGYYNLLDQNVQQKQIELAKQYGIEGFCFYLYWFSGKRLLEQPLDNYLNNPNLDLPFCVCWANENWSRRWDGLDQDLLMVQNYSKKDDLAFIEEISKYLQDPRYIRVNNKPLVVIYRPNLFPDIRATVKRWRKWCLGNGIGEIYLAYTQSFECVDPAVYGFDAAIEFPPNNSNPPNITKQIDSPVDDFKGQVFDWRVFIERSKAYVDPGYKLFRGACPSWDNTARKKSKGFIFKNSSPELFSRWLVNAFTDTVKRINDMDERLVFINAWNEWAEGAHLEPDERYGYGWLQAVRDAHELTLKKNPRIVIVSHDAHPHGAQILCLNFARYFKEQLHFDVEMIVLGEGRLITKFEEYANVHSLNLAQASKQDVNLLLDQLRSRGAEVAIVNTTVSGNIVPKLKAHGFSVVSLVHEMPGILNSYQLQEHAVNIADHADKVVFPAQQVQEGFEAFIGQSLPQAVIRPQGLYLRSLLREGEEKHSVRVNVRNKLGIHKHANIIMCAGYADHRKGFDLFVLACVDVMQRVPDTYALWVGHLDQKFVDQSLKPAELTGLRKNFLFTGLIDQPQEYYLAADIYGLTSREDPFPSVVMEALDAQTPVVAFEGCGGFENLIKRDCGLLVKAESHVSFADALVHLLKNPSRARELAQNGQKIIETEFSFRHYLFDLLAFAGRPTPKVSVVVPNYKYEKYIRQRLESVVNQTYPIYELIVLDDCSPDNSLTVINNFLKTCDVPHSLVTNVLNSGSVFRQWQKGIEMARGDLVWIAEADDLSAPEFLEKLIPFFQDPEVVLAYTQSKQIDENDNLLANDYLAYTNDVGDYWQQDYVVDGGEEIRRALCIKNTIPNVSGVVFRRDQLIQALDSGRNDMTAMKVAGDWVLYLQLAARGKVAYHATSLNMHRRHVNSVTKVNNHLHEVIAVQEIATRLAHIAPEQLHQMEKYSHKLREYFDRAAETV